jgi:hypothetical protein
MASTSCAETKVKVNEQFKKNRKIIVSLYQYNRQENGNTFVHNE